MVTLLWWHSLIGSCYVNHHNSLIINRSSFEPCVRSFTVAIKQVLNKGLDELNGMISFSIKVKGTGPKFNDYYVNWFIDIAII